MTLVIIRIVLLVYIGAIILLFSCQTHMIFPRGGALWATPQKLGFDYEDVRLEVNGYTTHGWFVPAPNEKGAVLFSHGNAGTMSDRLDTIRIFRELGWSIFIYDYGGYGDSTGKPSESRTYADIRAAWRYLTEHKDYDAKKIVLFGRSLGAGPTAQLSTEVTPGAVIIESAFTSTVRMGQEMFPVAPVKWFIRHRFDNESKVAKIHCPILIVHSPDDEIIPYAHGKRLFELANEPKEFLDITGGHNEGYINGDPAYALGLGAFLDQFVGTRSEEDLRSGTDSPQ